jgi:hypothetical protein
VPLLHPIKGSLDILLQRTGKQSGERLTFLQNGFYNDAFFLKALGGSIY